MIKYIHYGSNKFDINIFRKIVNRPLYSKPLGGLWASRIDSKRGWKDWCESEEFEVERLNESFTFTIHKNARVLMIDNISKLNKLPEADYSKFFMLDHSDFDITKFTSWRLLDFEKLKENYDAIEVLISKDYQLYWELYGWDCDSILIMNPEIIKFE